MNRFEPTHRSPWTVPLTAVIVALFGALILLATAPATAQTPESDDDWLHVMPCKDIESDHPDAVRRNQRGFLGVELTPLTEDLLRHFGVAGDGVMISKVTDSSPAQAAGLRVGDIVSRFDGRSIDSTRDLGRAVRDLPGRTVVAEVWREGKMQQLSVPVGEREMCSLDFGALMDGLDFEFDMEEFDVDMEAFSRMAAELGARSAEVGLRIADEVGRAMAEIDWEEQMENIEQLTEIDEGRMEALQMRLEELEERMEREYERFGEQYERELEQAMRQKERAIRAQERELRQQLEVRSKERRQRAEEGKARAEALRHEAEMRALEADERARAKEAQRAADAEEAQSADEAESDGGGTLDV